MPEKRSNKNNEKLEKPQLSEKQKEELPQVKVRKK
jgi:hypothetical protein